MEKVKRFIGRLLPVIYAYLAFFIINEIIISGGKHEGNIYTVILNGILLLAILWILKERFYSKPLMPRVFEGLTFALTFAVLDFALINTVAFKSDMSIYSTYNYYLYYGILLLIPVISPYLSPLTTKVKRILPNG